MIQRTLYNELNDHLAQKEITLIVGPRQAGKTTVMLALRDRLRKEGRKTVFLNLDIEADKRFFESQEGLIRKIQLEIGKEEGVIFIDEIQRKENAGLFLKGIYDMNLPYKFVVSGSGSLELKEKIHESLAGRKRVFKLSTLSFEEFINFKTDYQYQGKLLDFFSLEIEKTADLLKEYLEFGGYPRVVLAETISEKQRVIDEIFSSYVEKDIFYLIGVRKTEAFSNLVKVLASQVGNLVNYSELSLTLGISSKAVKDYIWYLEKTFILERQLPFYKNIRKEISKSPVIYFYDLGLKNYAIGLFGHAVEGPYAGFSFQNLVFQLLKEKIAYTPTKVNHWRTKDGAEVDFVITATDKLVPIEVKFKKLKQPVIQRSLRSFIEKYQPEKAVVVNMNLDETIMVNTTKIEFLPFYRLLDFKL